MLAFIIFSYALLKALAPIDGIESIHNHIVLQPPGHFYMIKQNTCHVFCRNYEINFDIRIDQYDDCADEIRNSLGTMEGICSKLPHTEECEGFLNDLWREKDRFQVASKEITTRNCKTRFKRTFDTKYQPKYMYSKQNFEAPRCASLNATFSQLDDEIRLLTNWTGKNGTEENTDSLLATMGRSLYYLRNYRQRSEYLSEVLCERSYIALLEIITTNKLAQEIRLRNQQALKGSCQIPATSDSAELGKLLEIASIQTSLTGQTLSLNIKLPSIYSFKYNLYRVKSLPFDYKDRSYTVKPTYAFYLISESRIAGSTLLYPLQNNDTENCIETYFGCICQTELPVDATHRKISQFREKVPENEQCLSKTAADLFNTQNTCELYAIEHENRIIQVSNNTFYLHIIQPTILAVICPYHDENITISKSKMIRVHEECSLQLAPGVLPENDETVNIFSEMHKINKTRWANEMSEKSKSWQMTLTVIACFSLLFLATWIVFGYTNRVFLEKIRQCISLLQSNPRPEPILDFDCSFTFSTPPLPPKKKRSQTIPKDLKVHYDVPRNCVRSTSVDEPSTSGSIV